MAVFGVWRGLGASPFLADITPRDHDPARIVATIVAGACVGLVASVACWILVLVPYTYLAGVPGKGMQRLGNAALMFEDTHFHDLGIVLVRLIASTATDGAFPLAFVSLAAVITGRPFLHYLTASSGFRWRLLVTGLGLSCLIVAPLIFAARAGGPPPALGVAPTLAGRLVYVTAALLLIPSAAAEELMFRGWLMHQLAAFTRRPVALVLITAAAFAAAHFDFAPDAFLSRAVMGAGFAYMALRTGGLELPIGAHAANNILFILFIQPFNLGGDAAGGDLFLGQVGLAAGYIAVTEAIVRIEPLRRWADVGVAEVSPAVGSPALIGSV
jgi:membrane protease YdiL (CAAX protease family)